ncbi:MAG TPA: inositol monophosphatase family protein [Solirubrobacteraceae bacterium]|nr:inositol monophosphatase family protein [Solirubrobacteraceae bacterium]
MEASAPEPDWLAACRRIAAELRVMLAAHPSTRERAVVVGRGEGGDRTLVIDRAAEELIFAELARLHAAGASFTAISEERGEVAFGGGPVRVVIDPIDGSMNAKRGLSPHAVSIAVADGPTMADVVFAFVGDLGSGEVWTASRGGGAWLDGAPLTVGDTERRNRDGRLELVAIESAHPARIAESGRELSTVAHRLRMFGSIAFALCQLAAGRIDGMATLWHCRSVDVAAAQLIVRESGGLVAFTAYDDPLGLPLDLRSRSPVVAARTAAGLAELATLPSSQQ